MNVAPTRPCSSSRAFWIDLRSSSTCCGPASLAQWTIAWAPYAAAEYPAGLPRSPCTSLTPAACSADAFSLLRTSACTSCPAFFRRRATVLPMYPVPPVTNTFIEPLRGVAASLLRSREPAAKREVDNSLGACPCDEGRSDCIADYAPSPPVRSETALGVGLTPTVNTRMCPECFGNVTSRGVSPSGLVFATDLPGVCAGAATQ